MTPWSVTNQMKATVQYFPVVLFIMLYKVVLTFKSVDEILKCDQSNESYWKVQVVLTFESVDEILKCDDSNESFLAVLFFGAVYYALQDGSNHSSDHSCNSYQAVFSWEGDGRRYM